VPLVCAWAQSPSKTQSEAINSNMGKKPVVGDFCKLQQATRAAALSVLLLPVMCSCCVARKRRHVRDRGGCLGDAWIGAGGFEGWKAAAAQRY